MKKITYYIAVAILAVTGLTSCEKDLMSYEGEESLYFDVRLYNNIAENLWPHRLHTAVSFGATMDDEIIAKIPVRATGSLKNYDRPFKVEVVADSTSAAQGVEFEPLASQYVIKAGTLSDTIKLVTHRTANINNDTLRVQLRIVPNEHFSTKFNIYQEANDYFTFVDPLSKNPSQIIRAFDVNNDASIHNIYIFDTMIQPKGWYGTEIGGIWGKFSAKKIRLIMEVCGCDLSAFESTSTMPSTRASSYGEKVGKYLIQQAKLGKDHAILDEDGSMMWVQYCTTGDVYYRWGQGYKPENCAFYNQ